MELTKKRMKLLSQTAYLSKKILEEGCGFIEKPYIDGFVTFLISNGIEIKYSNE